MAREALQKDSSNCSKFLSEAFSFLSNPPPTPLPPLILYSSRPVSQEGLRTPKGVPRRKLLIDILTFMAKLLSKDQINYQSWPQIVQQKKLVSCCKLLKTYSPSVIPKDGLKLYIFEGLKLKSKLKFQKKVLKCLKFGLSWGKNYRYTLCDAVYTCFQTFGVYYSKQKLFRENYLENVTSGV